MSASRVERLPGDEAAQPATAVNGAGATEPEPAPRRRRGLPSVRTKVLASVLVMSALGMAVAGATSFIIQDRRLDASVTAALRQEVDEFRTLAAKGIDPETGRPFASVQRLLQVALQRNVPDEHETYLTLLDRQPFEFDGGDRPVELEDEPTVLDAVAAVPADAPVQLRDVETSVGLTRVAIIPIAIQGQPTSGTYVIAFAVDRERAELLDLMQTYALVALGSLVLVGIVGWLVAGRLLRPLTLLREATARMDETDLGARIPVRGADDVSDLTGTYNAMLDRLQTAFETQRQFIDDAGHELRTPVTIVRGHLELMDPDDPTDVADTKALLLDEVDRMSRLVEDLMLLARARRPDFVAPGLVDLASLTDDALEKARGLGDRRWIVAARAEAAVPGDKQRLTQAVLQLAHNAVKFSEPGSTVSIGSELDGGEARIWVQDQGVGIHPSDVGRIFERFARAEAGRGVEGSGLGLSIVGAIVEAHRGRVDVTSLPGSGSRFTIVLPAEDGHEVPELHGASKEREAR